MWHFLFLLAITRFWYDFHLIRPSLLYFWLAWTAEWLQSGQFLQYWNCTNAIFTLKYFLFLKGGIIVQNDNIWSKFIWKKIVNFFLLFLCWGIMTFKIPDCNVKGFHFNRIYCFLEVGWKDWLVDQSLITLLIITTNSRRVPFK